MTTLITRDELAKEIEAGSVTVIDALGAEYYAKAHLPGALNLVEADVETTAPQLLPDKSGAIVTYCSNASCPNSQQVATKLEALGYTKCAQVPRRHPGLDRRRAAGRELIVPPQIVPGRCRAAPTRSAGWRILVRCDGRHERKHRAAGWLGG
ncbi:rhodanese-like domain-containing protein [Nocardia amamiensis]|uniref:rhodanese-like domain-containing protein n=1 Tax=Nocardia amamiensis TaxID=404578 RepID=UPI000A8F2BBF|nr:rhodanese-like domain-containing protein [Nocardia amamiensis]